MMQLGILTLVWITSRSVGWRRGGRRGVDQRTSVSLQLQGSVNQVPGVGIKKSDR